MTSRALFYKGMIEDLRHRIWMIALSCLASFMALPVLYLLLKQDWERRVERWYPEIGWDILGYKVESVSEFFKYYILISGGIVLGAGALIVGILGFRFVFSKKMVDLYHSIPITRKQLFFIHYLNGFLIWFVPMILGCMICAVMGLFFIGDIVAWMGTLTGLAITVLHLVLAFLIIYHLAMVAVMLSGNVLNTLVSGTIMSFVVLGLYGMYEAFANAYFNTYYSFFDENLAKIVWASPTVSAVYQLFMCRNGIEMLPFVMNIIMAVFMFGLSFWLYVRRPSELAEQGIKIKTVQVIFKTAVTILAGMAGWMFFGLLTDTDSIGWTVFGAVLASVLAYGVLDIIFHMDFKAFFKHKIQMVVTTVACVLIGFTFMFDWTGFDSYMPDKDKIANAGIYVQNIGSSNTSSTVKERLDRMQYEDSEVIYAILERITSRENNLSYPEKEGSTQAYICVTETSGKTYYRRYVIFESDEDLIVPVLRDPSYVETFALIPVERLEDFVLDGGKTSEVILENTFHNWDVRDMDAAKELLEAYNIDIMENPDLYIYQEEDAFAKAYYRHYGENYFNFRLDLYESMEHVISVLEKYGYDNMLEKPSVEEVAKIEINAYLYNSNNLKLFFGLEEESPEIKETESLEITTIEPEKVVATAEAYREYNYYATFENKEDIEELLDLTTYIRPNNYSMFGPEFTGCDVIIWLENGENYYFPLRKGVLPERFLDAFKKEEIIYN